MDGQVVAFDSKRGLGEIRGADDRSYPFHCTRIADGTRTIAVGVAVDFELAPALLGTWEARTITPT